MRDSLPDRLRDLLDPIGKKLGMDGAVEAGRLFSRWHAIVGADIAAHVEPTSLRDGVLRVRADSPSWATEIGYLAGEIAARVNAEVGRKVVNELRVTSGPRRSTTSATPPAQQRRRSAPRPSAEVPEDPRAAFERARRAWLAKRQKSGPDQGF